LSLQGRKNSRGKIENHKSIGGGKEKVIRRKKGNSKREKISSIGGPTILHRRKERGNLWRGLDTVKDISNFPKWDRTVIFKV